MAAGVDNRCAIDCSCDACYDYGKQLHRQGANCERSVKKKGENGEKPIQVNVNFHTQECTMCICETAFQIKLLGIVCLIYDSMTAVYYSGLFYSAKKLEVLLFLNIVYYSFSAAFAIILVYGVARKQKPQMENFIIGAKIKVFTGITISLLDVAVAKDRRQAMSANMHLEAIRNITYKGLRQLPFVNVENRPMDEGRSILLTRATVAAVANCFVIWRIQVFADKMGCK